MPHARTQGCSQSRKVATTADSCCEGMFGSQVQKPRRKGKSGKQRGARLPASDTVHQRDQFFGWGNAPVDACHPSAFQASSHRGPIAWGSVSPLAGTRQLCIEAETRRCLKQVERLALPSGFFHRTNQQIRTTPGWSMKRFPGTVSRRLSQWVMPTQAVGLSEDAESACVEAAVVPPSPLQSQATSPRSTRHRRLDRTARVPQIPFHGSSEGSG